MMVEGEEELRGGRSAAVDRWTSSTVAVIVCVSEGKRQHKFKVANIAGKRERFAHAVGANGFSVVRGVMDLIWWQNTLAVDPYTVLKGWRIN